MNAERAAREKRTCLSVSLVIKIKKERKRKEISMMVTVRRQVGEALVLAPLPFAVADVEVNLHRAGYSLVPVRRDLHNKSTLKYKETPSDISTS